MSGKRQDYISWDEYFMGVAILSGRRITVEEVLKEPNFMYRFFRAMNAQKRSFRVESKK